MNRKGMKATKELLPVRVRSTIEPGNGWQQKQRCDDKQRCDPSASGIAHFRNQ